MTKFIQDLEGKTQSVLMEGLTDDAAELTGVSKDIVDDAVKGLSYANYLELGNAIDIGDADTVKEILGTVADLVPGDDIDLEEDGDARLLKYYASKHPGPYDDELDIDTTGMEHDDEFGYDLKNHPDYDKARLAYFQKKFPAPYDDELQEDEEDTVDMMGETCYKCKKGYFTETGFHDDMDGVNHCSECGWKTDRYVKASSLKEADNPSKPAAATPAQPAVTPPSAGSSIDAIAEPAETAVDQDNNEMQQGRKEVDDLDIGDEIEVADIDGEPAAGRVRNANGPGDTIVITGKGDEEHMIRKDSILSTPVTDINSIREQYEAALAEKGRQTRLKNNTKLGDKMKRAERIEKKKQDKDLDEGMYGEETYDEMVESWKTSLSQYIVSKGIFTEMYDAAGQDIEVLNRAIESEAHSIAETYHGSGDGIGSSDINAFLRSIASDLGIEDLFGWNKSYSKVEEEDKEITYLKHPEGYEPPKMPERHKLDTMDWMYVQDDVIQMMKSFEHKMKSQNVWDKGVELAGSEDQLWKVMQWRAEEVMDTYRDSGEGIGSSDMNHFVRGVFSDIGEDDIWGWDKKEQGVLKSREEMDRDMANRVAKYRKSINAESLGEGADFNFFVDPQGQGANVMNSKGEIHGYYEDPAEARDVAAELNAEYGKVDEDFNRMLKLAGVPVTEAAKIACTKCDEVSTAKAWGNNDDFCPKCKDSSQGVAESKTDINEVKSGRFNSKAIGSTVKIVGQDDYGNSDHIDKTGTIISASREHTFSQMVPFVIVYGIRLEDGDRAYVRRENIRKVKIQETASGGATGAGAIASSPAAMNGVQKRNPSIYGQTKLRKKPEPKKRKTSEDASDGIGRSKKK